jgi:putative MATE family efflux protein
MPASEVIGELSPEGPLILNERNLGRNIFKLALPAILENLSHSIVFFVDLLMIGWLGSVPAVSAVGISGGLYFLGIIICIPFGIGVTALVARSVGARDHEAARKVAGQGVLMGAVFGLIAAGTAALLVPNIVQAMNIVGETRDLAIPYQRLIFGAFLFDVLMIIASGAMRGAGNTRTPMLIIAGVNAVNIILDWFLIFGHGPFPRLGVTGSGIATSTAIVLGGVFMVAALFTRYSIFKMGLRHLRRFSWRIMKNILAISLPSMIEQTFIAIGFIMFLRILTQLGDAAMAANSIAIRIESLSFLPGLGFAVAASTLTGQSLGAGDRALAEKSMKRTAFSAAFLMSIVGVFLALFPEFFGGLFDAPPPVMSLVVPCLIIGAMEQIPLALFMSLGGGLRGAGDTMSAMVVTFCGMILVRIPCAVAFAFGLGLGVIGVWIASLLDWIVRAVLIYNRVQRGSWRTKTVAVEETMPIVPELEGRFIDEG